MNIISISVEAFLADLLSNHWEELNLSINKHIANVVNYQNVHERVISDNKELRDIIRWDKIDRMKLIRVLIRCVDQGVEDLEKIKSALKNHNYKIKDLKFLLERKPDFIKHFPIDLGTINTSEAASLLSLGHEYYIDKIKFEAHSFNFKESMNIIKAYKYDRNILENVNYKSLRGSQIVDIILETDSRDLDILDLSKLTTIDWLNLLEFKPNMLSLCDLSIFKKSDIFYSIKLCCMFEEEVLYNLVLDRDIDEISPFGWEKLLIEKPEKFLAYCDFNKLVDSNWKLILESRPELESYKKTNQ